MKFETMELKVYEEYKNNVKKGAYDGIVLFEHLKSGDYLKDMECNNLNQKLFEDVSPKVKTDMEQGMLAEINRAPFFVRNRIRNAKYGENILTINVSNNVLSNIDKRIEEINKVLEESRKEDLKILSKLASKFDKPFQNEKGGIDLC